MRTFGIALCVTLALGCSGPSPAPAPQPAPPPAAVAQQPSSAGTVMRGLVVLSAEAPRLTPCGETTALDLRDQTGGRLVEVYGDLASAQTGEMWVELRAERGPKGVVAHGLLRALPVGEGDPCAMSLGPGEYRAFGNEPGWAVTVREGGLEWIEQEAQEPFAFPAVAPRVTGGATTWVAEVAGPPARRLELVVREAPCRDSMAGSWFALSAEATLDGRSLTGCAFAGGVAAQ